jgi:ribonuclease BN (tRNA processing enzyme)
VPGVVRITVLGKSPAWQDAGGACSSYLIEADGHRLLLDCGNGAFGKLRAACDFTTVEAVVISHLHADHFFDLVPYAYALTLSPLARETGARPILHAPPGGLEAFRRVAGTWNDEQLIERAFDVREYDASAELKAGPLKVRFHEVPHFVRTHAVQVRGAGGSFTYGADCAPNDEIVAFARETDLLMLESAVAKPSTDGVRGHLTPSEAGAHGRRASARRLVLTHISQDVDSDWARAEAERSFGGPVEIAVEGAVYEV